MIIIRVFQHLFHKYHQ